MFINFIHHFPTYITLLLEIFFFQLKNRNILLKISNNLKFVKSFPCFFLKIHFMYLHIFEKKYKIIRILKFYFSFFFFPYKCYQSKNIRVCLIIVIKYNILHNKKNSKLL